MPVPSELDLAALRKRLAGTSKAAKNERVRAPAQTGAPSPDTTAPCSEISGAGAFVLDERLYENSRSHGSLPIQRLQGMPGRAVDFASNGTVPSPDIRRWVFLDTETTGLSGGTGVCPFLVGTGVIEPGGFRTRLFFMRDFHEEVPMLQGLARHLAAFDTVVTFNGKTFDVPLLETRFRLKRQPSPLARMGHLDLLHASRRLWKRRLRRCRLADLEAEVLGFRRRGDVPGSLIPELYFNYVRSGIAGGLRSVFRHNRLDILSLACLTAMLLRCVDDPPAAPLRHGQDIFSLARWTGQRGDDESASRLYEKAIRAGLPPGTLADALWEAARHERRLGRHDRKVGLLRDLASLSRSYRTDAWIELAKHYEHREKDYAEALELTRRAMRLAPSDDLLHREVRLKRKLGKARDARNTRGAAEAEGSESAAGAKP